MDADKGAEHGSSAEQDVVVGVVGKPVGLRGEVYVRPDPDVGDDFARGRSYASSRGGQLTVASSRVHAGKQVVHFDGVATRAAAEALRGVELRLSRAAVGLDEDAFWTSDLLGREVVDDGGALVGVLEATVDGAAHDYLVVARPDGGEILVPAVAELVEVGDERIVVHAIPGLLDDEG